MRELVVCSVIVVVALTVEYIRHVNRPDLTAEYPVWRSILWGMLGWLGYIAWTVHPWYIVGVAMYIINVLVGLAAMTQFVHFVIWWRSQRAADAELNTVLDAFARDAPDPDYDDMERWCTKYPHLADHITIAAISRNADLMPELEPLQQGA